MHQRVAPSKTNKTKRSKWRRLLWVTAVAVLVGVGAYIVAGRGADPIAITTERAVVRDITQLVSATGKIRP
ncbi:MAG TPA: hypothetical protein VK775_16205, partial [Chthoniobacterales bacterium]|nr:hypothetical protein [Chthoniobacterales bacterium]